MPVILIGSHWIHHITNEFVTVLRVKDFRVEYQDNMGLKSEQGTEWFLSSYIPLDKETDIENKS